MGMGHLFGDTHKQFFSRQAILDRISHIYTIEEQPKPCGDTATYWRTACGHHFGIIANESHPFAPTATACDWTATATSTAASAATFPYPCARSAVRKA